MAGHHCSSPPTQGQLFNGVYVYGDYCSGTIWRISATAAGGVSNSVLLPSGLMITTFGEDENGEIYVADAGTGKIREHGSSFAGSSLPAFTNVVAGQAALGAYGPGPLKDVSLVHQSRSSRILPGTSESSCHTFASPGIDNTFSVSILCGNCGCRLPRQTIFDFFYPWIIYLK